MEINQNLVSPPLSVHIRAGHTRCEPKAAFSGGGAAPNSPKMLLAGDSSNLLAAADCPQVIRKIAVGEVSVGHCEVAFDPPVGAPRVAHGEPLVLVVVSDRQHGVPTNNLLARLRHLHRSGVCHLLRFETFVNRKPEHEGISVSQT